jgi:hypothetical protein
MFLRTVFTVTTSGRGLEAVELPLETSPEEGVTVILSESDRGLRLTVHRPVDASHIEAVVEGSGWHRDLANGKREPLPRLRLKGGIPVERVVADDFVHTLSFLTDVPLWLSRPQTEDAFVPDTDEDKALLKSFGTDQPFYETSAQVSIRTFSPVVDATTVTSLGGREPGLRLYADAIKLPTGVAQFRELWRVLESAFATTDRALVTRLTGYAPSKQLGFDESELEALLVLRGRASHAQSKAGTRELMDVDQECKRLVPRLKNLVERVILTKQSWGYPTSGVDELTPLRAYLTGDGGIVLIQPSGYPE